MDSQTSFRLPVALSRALAREARQRGVPKSQIVREALERHLAPPVSALTATTVRERTAPYLGLVRLPREGASADALDRTLRERNWRD